MAIKHNERKHSKFSASGSERWFACPGSVALSEGLPDKSSVWSLEGTKAHEVLEQVLFAAISAGATKVYYPKMDKSVPRDMIVHGTNAANFILGLHAKTPGSELLVETRVYLSFIHPEMFGTFDSGVPDHFGTLHVFDYKYGAGHAVAPKKNLQMIFYGIGLAYLYGWNFKRVRLWIIQPRVRGYDGPAFWDISIQELLDYVPLFEKAVKRAIENPTEYVEGSHCHWCKAKGKCPLKNEKRIEKAQQLFTPVFTATNKGEENGKKEENEKESRKEKAGQKEVPGQKESAHQKEARQGRARNRTYDDFY